MSGELCTPMTGKDANSESSIYLEVEERQTEVRKHNKNSQVANRTKNHKITLGIAGLLSVLLP